MAKQILKRRDHDKLFTEELRDCHKVACIATDTATDNGILSQLKAYLSVNFEKSAFTIVYSDTSIWLGASERVIEIARAYCSAWNRSRQVAAKE